MECLECHNPITRHKFCSRQCSTKFRTALIAPTIQEKDLKKDYVEDKLSPTDISKKYNISITTVHKYLRKYKIQRHPVYIDFCGKKVGKLLVLEPLNVNNKGGGKHIKWRCQCECGNEWIAFSNYLNKCLTNNKPAECLSCAYLRRRAKIEFKNYMWKSIVKGAVSRELDISIDKDFAYKLFISQKRKCALSGLDIQFATCISDHNQGLTTASLDRIDSSKGYTKDNIQWVHKAINFMKGNLPMNEFTDWCTKIATYKDQK